MLRETNSLLMAGNYVGVKLVSGEEVLCKLGNISDTVELIRPHFIAQTAEGVVFMPWPQLVDHKDEESHTITIEKSKLLAPFKLRPDFEAELRNIMGDTPKIFVPDKKIIT